MRRRVVFVRLTLSPPHSSRGQSVWVAPGKVLAFRGEGEGTRLYLRGLEFGVAEAPDVVGGLLLAGLAKGRQEGR